MATLVEARRALEFKRCQQDLVYFLRTYWKVQTVGVGYGRFELYDYQVQDATHFQRLCEYADKRLANPKWRAKPGEEMRLRQIRLKSRQLGWTTLGGGAAFWSAYFKGSHPWLLLAQGQDDANKTMAVAIKQPFAQLPLWMRNMGPEVLRETGEELEFANGSSITSLPSTSSSGRGRAVFGTLLDENAFMSDPADVFAAVDPMTYGPLYVWSTANGMGNFFHETWLDSQLSDSAWEGTFHPWHSRPGRDDEWYEATKRKYRGREHLFYQEHPSTPEEAFAKSGNTAMPMDILRDTQDWCRPDWRYDLQLVRSGLQADWDQDWDGLFRSAEIGFGKEADFELHVWEKPFVERDDLGRVLVEPNYVVAVDVAEGLLHGDLSAVSVRNVETSETVATVNANIPVHDLAEYVEIIGYWYHTALVGVERNNFGLLPLSQLQDAHYPRLYRMDTIAQIKMGDRTPRYGYHTNRATKPMMVNDFNKAVIDGTTALHDERLLHQFATFLSDGRGGFSATYGNHDDLIMAELIALQLEKDVGKFPVVWYDAEPSPITFGEVLSLAEPPDDTYGMALAGGIGNSVKEKRVLKSFEMVKL